MTDSQSFFERVGGMPFFEALVVAFYRDVATDDILRPLYPEQDLEPAQRRLTLFLVPVLGRPPHLRSGTWPSTPADAPCAVRHRWRRARPVAGPDARRAAAPPPQERPIPADAAVELDRYLEMAADAMRNRG